MKKSLLIPLFFLALSVQGKPLYRDLQTGIVEKLSLPPLPQHTAQVGVTYQFKFDPDGITDIQTFEGVYAHRFGHLWTSFFFSKANGTYDGFTGKADLQVLGISLGYRSRFSKELFKGNAPDFFESIRAGLGYYSLAEHHSQETYTGPGLKTDFELTFAGWPSFYYGFKFTYHLAHLTRPSQNPKESHSERSRLITWLSGGFDISFYF